MRVSIALSFLLPVIVSGLPVGTTIPGAAQVPGTSQRISSSKQAENYAAKNGQQAQANLVKSKQVAQQVMQENPNIPEANVRSGKHDFGSQGVAMNTIQMPAQPGAYHPPNKGTGAGTVAVHVPSVPGPGGVEQIDRNRPVITQPIPNQGKPANANQGKTASYNPSNPVPLNGPVRRMILPSQMF